MKKRRVALIVAPVVSGLLIFVLVFVVYKGAKGLAALEGGGQSRDEALEDMSKKATEKVQEMQDKLDKLNEKKEALLARVEKIRAFFQSARTPLKIFITFCQISGGLSSGFEFKYPTSLSNILDKLSIFDFDIGSYAAQSCLFPSHFYDNLLIITLGPLFLGAILLVIFGCTYSSKSTFWRSISEEVFKLFLLGTYLIMPGATKKIMTTFSCDYAVETDDPHNKYYGAFLSDDQSIQCYSWDGIIDSKYRFFFWYSVGMIFVYPLGITGFYGILVYLNRHTIDPGQDELSYMLNSEERGLKAALEIRDKGPHTSKHKMLAFLYEAYEPKVWWFEVFECVRRLLLTAGVMVLAPGTAVQIAVAMVICLVSMRVYALYSPYINPRDDILAEIMQWQIFFTMFGAMLMKANKGDASIVDEATRLHNDTLLGFLLVAINAVGPAMIIIHSFVSGEAKRQMIDKYNQQKEKLLRILGYVPCVGKRASAVINVMEERASEQEARLMAKAAQASARKGETVLAVLLEKYYKNDVQALWLTITQETARLEPRAEGGKVGDPARLEPGVEGGKEGDPARLEPGVEGGKEEGGGGGEGWGETKVKKEGEGDGGAEGLVMRE